jgi:hypothetical protein
VCELWNGREIIRQAGRPKILEFIFSEDETGVCIGDLANAVTKEWMINKETKSSLPAGLKLPDRIWEFMSEAKRNPAPNLALNAGNVISSLEKWTFAIIAVTLQVVAVIIPAVSTYNWHWKKGSKDAQEYAYPCYLVGTLAVCLGVSLCSHVIDLATKELDVVPSGKKKIGPIFCIQMACTIGEQDFPNTVIMNSTGNQGIQISKLRPVTRGIR